MKNLSALEKAAIAEEVASLVRHDLRNRLSAIGNATAYLRNRTRKTDLWKEDARVERFFGIVDEELAAASRLMTERLALGELFGRDVRAVALAECVGAAVEAAAPPSGVRVEVALSEEAMLQASPAEITLLLRCLLDNAIEAAGAGGVVQVSSHNDESSVLVAIADSGPGFSPESRSAALLPFTTHKPGHSGIGLNIASRIAVRYGGALTIAEPPQGARVELRIPRRR
jgi:signal transduction histidine kinase